MAARRRSGHRRCGSRWSAPTACPVPAASRARCSASPAASRPGPPGHRVRPARPRRGRARRGSSWWPPAARSSLRANGSVAPVSLSSRAPPGGHWRALRAVGPDVVHVHEPFAPGLPYGVLLAGHLPPLVATFHRSGGSVLYTLLGPLARRLARRLAVRCAVSEAAAATARQRPGRNLRGVVQRHRGRPASRGRALADRPARPSSSSAATRSARAWRCCSRPSSACCTWRGAVAHRRGAAPVLWIAGDGPQTDALRRRHPESATVHWLGVLPRRRRSAGWRRPTVVCAPVPRAASPSAWCCSRPWRPAPWWWRATSTGTGRRPAATPCWCRPATPRPWRRPWPGCSPASWHLAADGGATGWRRLMAAAGGPAADVDGGAADGSSGRGPGRAVVDGPPRPECYEALYPSGPWQSPALSGRTLLGP